MNKMLSVRDRYFKVCSLEDYPYLSFVNGKLCVSKTPMKAMKIIRGRYKIYVDAGFKGNSRYADDQSDFYVLDMKDNTILSTNDTDYKSIVKNVQKMYEEETPFEDKIAPFVTDTRVMIMTIQNLVNDGWSFIELEEGQLQVNDDEGKSKVFKDEEKLKKWIFEQAENY